jgi:hypothetical protein
MNKQRRQRLRKASIYLSMSLNIIEDVKDDEETVLNNIPENLQESSRAYDMENNIESLEDAIDYLNDVINSIEEVV